MNLSRRTTLFASLAGAAGLVGLRPAPAHAQPSDEEVVGPRVIEMAGLAAPVRRDQQLIGYVFLTIRTTLAANVDVWATRERNHFLRDAFVRACYRNRLVDPDQPTQVLEPAASQAFRAAAVEVLGARTVHAVVVSRYQGLGQRDAAQP